MPIYPFLGRMTPPSDGVYGQDYDWSQWQDGHVPRWTGFDAGHEPGRSIGYGC